MGAGSERVYEYDPNLASARTEPRGIGAPQTDEGFDGWNVGRA